MVRDIGGDPDNVPAYDAFLTTIVSSNYSMALPKATYYLDFLKRHDCLPGTGQRFFHAALVVHLEAGELRGATYLSGTSLLDIEGSSETWKCTTQ